MDIQKAVSYNPETGDFTWLVTRGRANKGSVAGKVDSHGYRSIGLDGKHYRAHRVAWLLQTGAWPEMQIDHRNGDRLDNRWENLREVTPQENQQNCCIPHRNPHGYVGVRYRGGSVDPWEAIIRINFKQEVIGRYATAKEAGDAYLAAKAIHHPAWTGAQATSAEVGE
ncbi:hypothetical protein ARC78_15015 [Stenotrophomonas pictorum JCM 9942]|uniref:HNH nuclease domain-containing protein n=1 Tax=Stenotrophomonas pictorum JCM 9942 TaxID=1236960 RepID=A0A0R0A1R6_9GAMM|nr:HNH endonuclease signature motif containing protein [Stenotrophomonas pictorum]KRG39126.1 hypothetical protein ARC78_15015 [Stenotrophomonas pictorum JCM 9942]